MATVDTLPSVQNPAFQKVEPQVHDTPKSLQADHFDAKRHLAFEPPKEVYTLDELGLGPEGSISPVAITAPFPLLSNEGIRAPRADLFRHDILKHSKYPAPKH